MSKIKSKTCLLVGALCLPMSSVQAQTNCRVVPGSEGQSTYDQAIQVSVSQMTMRIQVVANGNGTLWALAELDGVQCDPGEGFRAVDLNPRVDHVALSCQIPRGRHVITIRRHNTNATNRNINFCGDGFEFR